MCPDNGCYECHGGGDKMVSRVYVYTGTSTRFFSLLCDQDMLSNPALGMVVFSWDQTDSNTSITWLELCCSNQELEAKLRYRTHALTACDTICWCVYKINIFIFRCLLLLLFLFFAPRLLVSQVKRGRRHQGPERKTEISQIYIESCVYSCSACCI